MAVKSPSSQPHLRPVPPAAGTRTSAFGGRPSARERLLGFFAVLGISALVLGVPAVLVTLFGWPLPTRLPDRDMLTAPVTTDTLLNAVAVLTWIGYLHFLWCLIVEARAALAGRGLPGRVPLGGSSQDLARRLVTTALLLVTATPGLAAASAVFDPPASPPAVTADATAGTTARERAPRPADPTELADAAAADAGSAAATALPYGGEFGPGTRLYVVQPPQGRHHDNLWDIAERHLGEGRRYREIFELNQHREQPDGDHLELARLIQPGWILVMPPDAIGVDVVPEPAPPIPAPAPAGHEAAGDGGADAVGDAAADVAASQSQSGRPVAPELVGAGLLTSGLLVALAARRQAQRRRRRAGEVLPVPDPDSAAVEVTLRLAADPAGSAFLDAALRALAAACKEAGRPFPSIYAVRLGPERAELLLALPEDDAPAPFAAHEGGRRWTVDRSAPLAEPPAGVRPPLPGLVGLGTDPAPSDPAQPETQLLVDLEAAGGLVGVDGDPAIVREILAAAAVELATNGWSDSLRLTLVGFGDGLRDLAPDRVLTVERLDDVLPELERRVAETAVLLDQHGIGSVLTGRLRGVAGELLNPDYVILAQPPDTAAQDRLAALVRDGHRFGLAVLSAGPVRGAPWRLAVASEHELSIDALGLTVEPQRLGAAAYDAVVELARTAASPPLPPPSGAGAAAGRDRLTLVSPRAAIDSDPGGAAALRPRPPAPVEIRVLGPLQITGDALDDVRRTQSQKSSPHCSPCIDTACGPRKSAGRCSRTVPVPVPSRPRLPACGSGLAPSRALMRPCCTPTRVAGFGWPPPCEWTGTSFAPTSPLPRRRTSSRRPCGWCAARCWPDTRWVGTPGSRSLRSSTTCRRRSGTSPIGLRGSDWPRGMPPGPHASPDRRLRSTETTRRCGGRYSMPSCAATRARRAMLRLPRGGGWAASRSRSLPNSSTEHLPPDA